MKKITFYTVTLQMIMFALHLPHIAAYTVGQVDEYSNYRWFDCFN